MGSRTDSEQGATARAAAAGLPLSTLLSHVLVAFTIELDNEFEHQTPHRTARYGSTGGLGQGPWLASMVMWSNCMRFVGEEGTTVRELERLARTKTNWNGMERWGYIVVKPDPADTRPKPPRSDWLVYATPKGRKAREVWRPLFGAIEKRWRERFGDDEITRLRESLWAVVSQMDLELPDCLPILNYGLFSKGSDYERRAPGGLDDRSDADLPLSALLSRVLLAFAIDFERESELSLAISANIVRVLDEKGVRVRDLPILSGVSKEAISMALGFLQKKHVVVVEPDPNDSRTKIVRLTSSGRKAQDAYHQLLVTIEERWQAGFGKKIILNLRRSLEVLVGEPVAEKSPLFRALNPYPDGWRALVRKPNTLPHYPMVLHRGGYPDGS
jgi:DNA-binding MarR family transcriptional regulator